MAKDYPKAVEKIRTRIERTQGEIAELRLRRLTHEETAARLRQWVRQRAERADPGHLVASLAVVGQAPNADALRHADTLDLLCALAPDTVEERLLAELERRAPDVCASLPAEKRQEALAHRRAELARLEREEERLICEAESAGVEIPRRPEADPAAILEATA